MSKKKSNPYLGFLNSLSKKSLPYDSVIKQLDELFKQPYQLDLETISLLGLSLKLSCENTLSLSSRTTPLKEQVFCVLDLEATGSKNMGSLLEIGAVKVKNKKIIDSFQSLIKVDYIPPTIVDLTGIDVMMTQKAPKLSSVLSDFRLFLGDAIFVAHNANCDFSYLSHSFLQCDLGPLLNQQLCTYKLSCKLVKAPRHGLAFLKDHLKIQSEHHRALSDAKAAADVFIHCLEKLPVHVKTTQELLDFS